MNTPEPIFVLQTFRELQEELVLLLRAFDNRDWEQPTIAGNWRVKDVAAHLLDGQLRSLSILRDEYQGEKPGKIESYQDLVDFLNRLNAEWITAMKRISPALLLQLLEMAGHQYLDLLESLDPFAPAAFSVAWAGEEQSLNWFHIAREYTELWHHQQQIRLAVGQTNTLYQKKYYYPYLEVSMRALPHHYREVSGRSGATIQFSISGPGGGDWYLVYDQIEWKLASRPQQIPVCKVEIPEAIAWRIFTKGIDRRTAIRDSRIQGDHDLGERVFNMLAVMA